MRIQGELDSAVTEDTNVDIMIMPLGLSEIPIGSDVLLLDKTGVTQIADLRAGPKAIFFVVPVHEDGEEADFIIRVSE